MNESDIHAFLLIARTGSLNRAANLLFITQPALSQQLKALETELNTTLFYRKKGQRTVSLTASGRHFYQIAQKFEALYTESMQLRHIQEVPILSVNAVASLNYGLLPPLYQRMSNRTPPISLKLVTGKTEQIYQNILSQNFDIGLVHRDLHLKDLQLHPIFEEQFYFVCWKGAESAFGLDNSHDSEDSHALESSYGLDDSHGLEDPHSLKSSYGLEGSHGSEISHSLQVPRGLESSSGAALLCGCRALSPAVLNPSKELYFSWSVSYNTWREYWFGESAQPHVYMDQGSLIEPLLIGTDNWAIIPASVLGIFRHMDQLRIMKLTETPPPRTCYAITRSDLLPETQSLVDLFLDGLKKVAEENEWI